ncbi:GUN4 domain-containing protein [Lyngbya aestuarii]|uniref:GUN4 domain-containing protein n=1 Tax=Lyngbya aestuarii TaxID=118322 RepID=UPI00403D6665
MSSIIGVITVIASAVVAGVLAWWVSKQHQRKENKQSEKAERRLLDQLQQERLQREAIERQRTEEQQQREASERRRQAQLEQERQQQREEAQRRLRIQLEQERQQRQAIERQRTEEHQQREESERRLQAQLEQEKQQRREREQQYRQKHQQREEWESLKDELKHTEETIKNGINDLKHGAGTIKNGINNGIDDLKNSLNNSFGSFTNPTSAASQKPSENSFTDELKDSKNNLENSLVNFFGKLSSPSSEKTPTFVSRLYELLKSGKWEEADKETLSIMLRLADREKEGWLDVPSIENFPSEPLRIIDQLWLKYSNGHFGFSVQKRIWESVGGNLDADDKIRQAFSDCIGWRLNENWLQVDDLNFKLSARVGHLPAVAVRLGGLSWGIDGFWWDRRNAYEFLLSRKDW